MNNVSLSDHAAYMYQLDQVSAYLNWTVAKLRPLNVLYIHSPAGGLRNPAFNVSLTTGVSGA